MLIDSHCHLTYDDLAPQVGDVLARARSAGVGGFVNVATTPDDALRAFELLGDQADIWFVIGVHPHEAGKPPEEIARLGELLGGGALPTAWRTRIVAIGETGLDFHYDFAPRQRQEAVLRTHIELALRHDLPVVIHAREAEERVIDVLGDYDGLAGRVVFHCYSGSLATARRLLDAGYWASFTGVVTFKNAAEVAVVAQYVPEDRFMIETDAPYLSPVPVRKIRPNEPALIVHTQNRLAELRGVAPERIAELTTANAVRFFKLPEVNA